MDITDKIVYHGFDNGLGDKIFARLYTAFFWGCQ